MVAVGREQNLEQRTGLITGFQGVDIARAGTKHSVSRWRKSVFMEQGQFDRTVKRLMFRRGREVVLAYGDVRLQHNQQAGTPGVVMQWNGMAWIDGQHADADIVPVQ